MPRRYVLSPHAEMRMRQRGVSATEVRHVMRRPQHTEPTMTGREMRWAEIDGRRITLIVEFDAGPATVVTLWIDE